MRPVRGPPAGTGEGTEEASTHTGRPFDAPPIGGASWWPRFMRCVWCTVRLAVGSAHLAHLTRCPHPSPSYCWTPTPLVERTRRSRRGHRWLSRCPPRVGPPPHHLPFIPITHPATMQGRPHLPCQHRMGVASTAPFTHPHHHAPHLSHGPRWRCHRSVGTTPHYLATQTHAGHIPHHALSRPPLQAQGDGEATHRASQGNRHMCK